jgi:hypothetical protein
VATYDDDSLVRKARDAATIKGESEERQAAIKAEGEVESKRVESGGRLKLQRELIAAKDLEANDAAMGDWRSYRASKDKAFDPALVATKAKDLAATGDVRGFEGVANPVHVIRRMKSTYAGGAPGEEFGTATRAMQGINRYYGIGEYVSPEVAKQEALALKDPKKVAEAEAARYGLAMDAYTKIYGRTDESGKKALHPEMESTIVRALRSGEDLNAPDSITKFDKLHKDITLADELNDPKKNVSVRDNMVQFYKSLPANQKDPRFDDETAAKLLKTGPASTKTIEWFRKYGGMGGPALGGLPAPQPGSVPPVAAAPPATAAPPVGSAEEAASIGIGVARPAATAAAPTAAPAAPGASFEDVVNNPLAAAGSAIRTGAAGADKVWDPIARAWINAGGTTGKVFGELNRMDTQVVNPTGMPLEMSPGAVEAAQQHQLGLEVLRAEAKPPEQWTPRERELMWARQHGGKSPSAMGGFSSFVRPSVM